MDGTITIGTEVDTAGVQDGVKDIKNIVEEETPELDINVDKQSKGMRTILQLTKKIGRGFLGISATTAKFLGGIIKLVAKLGLIGGLISIVALVGLGIVSAFTEAIKKDEELETKLQYLKFAMKSAFEGIGTALVNALKWVIDRVIELIGFVGRIIYLISGVNIFKNSGIDKFQKSLGKAEKSAKEINKILAGFDEATVLSNSNAGGIGGGGNYSTVEVPDLSKIVEQESALEILTQKLIDKWINLGEEMKKALDNPQLFNQTYGKWGLFVQGIVRMFYGLYDVINGITQVVGGVLDIIVGIFTGNFELIKSGFKSVINGIAEGFSGLINIVKGIFQTIFGVISGVFGTLWELIKTGAVGAFNGIVNVFAKFGDFFYNIFSSAWKKVKNLFSQGGAIFTGIKDGIVNAFKAIVNGLITGINKIIATPFEKINGLLNKIRSIEILGVKPFKNLWDKNPLPVPKIPKLARGGIVSNPGKGVMMGNYIAGEGRYPEAVIPLDDATLDRLGLAFAKHTTINATIPVYAYNRQVDRQIRIIRANDDFASNR